MVGYAYHPLPTAMYDEHLTGLSTNYKATPQDLFSPQGCNQHIHPPSLVSRSCGTKFHQPRINEVDVVIPASSRLRHTYRLLKRASCVKHKNNDKPTETLDQIIHGHS